MDTFARRTLPLPGSEDYLQEIQEQINQIKEILTPAHPDDPKAYIVHNHGINRYEALIEDKSCDEKYIFKSETPLRLTWDLIIIICVLYEG